MKKILLVVHPKWCKMIFRGKKTIEVRKNYPLQVKPPFEVLVYCTAIKDKKHYADELYVCAGAFVGNRKVIGSFICDRIDEIEPDLEYYSDGYDIDDDRLAETCLTREKLCEYGKGKILYGWHIAEPKLFDKPRELSEFYIPCKWYEKGNGCPEDCALFDYEGAIDDTDDFCLGKRPIIRPPQSFCYIEEYPKCLSQ